MGADRYPKRGLSIMSGKKLGAVHDAKSARLSGIGFATWPTSPVRRYESLEAEARAGCNRWQRCKHVILLT